MWHSTKAQTRAFLSTSIWDNLSNNLSCLVLLRVFVYSSEKNSSIFIFHKHMRFSSHSQIFPRFPLSAENSQKKTRYKRFSFFFFFYCLDFFQLFIESRRRVQTLGSKNSLWIELSGFWLTRKKIQKVFLVLTEFFCVCFGLYNSFACVTIFFSAFFSSVLGAQILFVLLLFFFFWNRKNLQSLIFYVCNREMNEKNWERLRKKSGGVGIGKEIFFYGGSEEVRGKSRFKNHKILVTYSFNHL